MRRTELLKRLAFVTTTLLFAVGYVEAFKLRPEAAGLKLMDLRPQGYSAQMVEAYRAALSFEGQGIYGETYLVLDGLFMVALFGCLMLVARGLQSARLRQCLVCLALVYLASDVIEDLGLRDYVLGHGTFPLSVTTLSFLTIIKFVSLLLAAGLLIVAWRKGEMST